jgi:RNA polymerase sigma-70 factor, ECF subfamily
MASWPPGTDGNLYLSPMRLRLKSIRLADFPADRDGVFRPMSAIGGEGRSGFGTRAGQQDTEASGESAEAGGPGLEGAESNRSESSATSKSLAETVVRTQPSGPDGVPEDMATLVLDNPAIGLSGALARGGRKGAARETWELRRDAVSVDPASDAATMLRVAAGDESAFNYLVQKYHRPMIHFLFRMVHNQAVAEELAQDVFLRVYRSRETYRAEAKFTTWLYRIATNLAVNYARDTRHERAAQNVYLDAPDEETGTTPDVADDEPTAEQKLMRDERMAAIRQHVMALPERQRMAVLMHKYQGMDYRQIGEVLKLSESATKSLLFRAYQTLRDRLKEFV